MPFHGRWKGARHDCCECASGRFLFGAIFTNNPDAKTVRRLEDLRRMFGALLLMISGIIPDIGSAWAIPTLSCS